MPITAIDFVRERRSRSVASSVVGMASSSLAPRVRGG
jgi:hypothetical protein